jgi:hypothetical protein
VIACVLAIPAKCYDQRLVTFLSEPELDALLADPAAAITVVWADWQGKVGVTRRSA